MTVNIQLLGFMKRIIREVIKMVKLRSSKMFIKDPVDAWGDEKIVGLAEHNARKLAPPITQFIKNGNIVFWDGFETGTKRYATYQVLGGTAERSTEYTQYEEFSLKCIPTGGAGSQAGAQYYITDFHEDTKILVKASVTSPDATGWFFYIAVDYFTGSKKYSSLIRYSADGTVSYYSSLGAWVVLSTIEWYGNVLNWGSISAVIDLASKKYDSVRVYRSEFDMSYDISSVNDTDEPHLEIKLYFEDIAGTSIVAYLDDVIIMENVA